jgi:tripartite-type tricarboxylate transporter receptor subunit TctC
LVTKDAPFDPVKDFAGITRLGSAPLFLIAHPDVPAKTCEGGHRARQEGAGKLNFSSPGLASTTFIAGAQFRRIAGINIVHVPFRSAPDAVTAVIRGDAHFYFAPSNLAARSVRGRQGAGDCAATATAHSGMPNVPTFTEAGCRSSMTPGSA